MFTLAIITVLAVLILPLAVVAKSLDEIKQQEESARQQNQTLTTEIQNALSDVNKKYHEVDKLDREVNGIQKKIKNTQANIEKTEKSIDRRTTAMAERMQTLQVRGNKESILNLLLESDNLSDFMTRLLTMSIFQNAERSKIETLYSDKEKLAQMKASLDTSKASLDTKKTEAEKEAAELKEALASLKTKAAANQANLQRLAAERQKETKRLDDEKAAKAAAEKRRQEEAQKAKNQTTDSSAVTNDDQTDNSSDAPSPSPINPGGDGNNTPAAGMQWGQATAYIATGDKTRTGTIPMPGRTIAVDENTIPLGSLVEIRVPSAPKYSGIYYAEDTGGAVQGNIIDIFVGSNAEAISFGRRAIQFAVR